MKKINNLIKALELCHKTSCNECPYEYESKECEMIPDSHEGLENLKEIIKEVQEKLSVSCENCKSYNQASYSLNCHDCLGCDSFERK